MMIAVLGINDVIGEGLLEDLLRRRIPTRVIDADPVALRRAEQLGAETRQGRFDDNRFVSDSLRGAAAAFVRLPVAHDTPDLRRAQGACGAAIADAVARSGVRKLVNLSTMGADLSSGTGPLVGYFDQEERLNRLPKCDVLHVRPAWLMEAIVSSILAIERQGEVVSRLRKDLAFQSVASRDVGEVAAEWLAEPEFEEKSELYVFGPAKTTMHEVTSDLARALSRPDLKYRELDDDEALEKFRLEGQSAELCQLNLELLNAMNKGLMGEPGGAFTRGQTTLSDFIRRLATSH